MMLETGWEASWCCPSLGCAVWSQPVVADGKELAVAPASSLF